MATDTLPEFTHDFDLAVFDSEKLHDGAFGLLQTVRTPGEDAALAEEAVRAEMEEEYTMAELLRQWHGEE
jgi:hypothetical protein